MSNTELAATTREGIAAERTIEIVTGEIRLLHRQAQQMALGYAIEIGRRLVEAKGMLEHGEWGGWLKTETEFSQSTANNFMRIFEEYGAAQLGLFGGEANSQTLGNLSFSKALALLVLPADEREEFVDAHDVEAMSTRELRRVLQELEEARSEKENAERETAKLATELEELGDELVAAEEIRLRLEDELKELQARPVEVTGSAVPDEGMIAAARLEGAREAETMAAAAREEAEKDLKDKLAEAEEVKAKLEDKVKKLQAERKSAAKDVQAERDAALARAAAMEKQLAVAGNPHVTAFKFYFEGAQRQVEQMVACLTALEAEGDGEHRAKLGKAMEALGAMILERSKPKNKSV